MKKAKLIFFLTLPLLLASCGNKPFTYSDDTPFVENLTTPSLRIAQFTDTHFTYGFDRYDKNTLALITKVVEATNPDIVVFTGDQTLSISAPRLYKQLARHMESLQIPWSFVFGNHDDDYHTHTTIIRALETVETTYLRFKSGPKLEKGGYGNFAINYYYDGDPFYNLYMLDSKTEQKKLRPEGLSRYDHLSPAQVAWYDEKAQNDATLNVPSTIFMHVPLVQYLLYEDYMNSNQFVGEANESVYSQNIDTGLFSAITTHGVSQAVFAGHDHRNNFAFYHENVLLGYGQNSGFNSYGTLQEGARIIDIDENKTLSTFIIYGDLTDAYHI